ncbi:hypothetical protein [Streptomyces sp. NPDC005732]|uniref:hypothetical protein n=1 Tax=Streptomyces sp. NPDC005732 TaxID=3157057 RepID=UPI0033E23BF8
MTDTRRTADTINDDELGELYADLDRYEEVQGEMNENAIDLARRAARAEAAVARVRELHRPAECANARCKQRQWCIGCDPDGLKGDCSEYPYPCPTILAIATETTP